MKSNGLLDKMTGGQVVLGVVNMYPAAGIIEGMCPGFDYVWIDGQHGQMHYEACLDAMVASRGVGIDTVIRVPTHDHGLLGMYADLSPSAIMVPMVNTVEQAKAVVDALCFAPLGNRSYGGRRVIDLGGREFFRERKMLVISQVETLEAVANMDQIIDLEGIDMLFYGPDDMRCQLGLPMNTGIFDNEKLKDGFIRTAQVARKAGKLAGTVAGNAEGLKQCVEAGYNMVVVGGDIKFMRVHAVQTLDESRAVLEGQKVAATSGKSNTIYGA